MSSTLPSDRVASHSEVGYGDRGASPLARHSCPTPSGNAINQADESINYCNKFLRINSHNLSVLGYTAVALLVGDDDYGATPIYFNKDVRVVVRVVLLCLFIYLFIFYS